jgi:hypothetical protein
MEDINTFSGKNCSHFNDKSGGTSTYHCALIGLSYGQSGRTHGRAELVAFTTCAFFILNLDGCESFAARLIAAERSCSNTRTMQH